MRADLAPVACRRRSIDPDVRVLHRRLEIGEAALGRLDTRCVLPSGDQRGWYSALSVAVSAPDRFVGELQREDVVVEELVLVRLAVRDESDLVAVRRPVDRMLVVRAVGQLLDASRTRRRPRRCAAAGCR